MSWRLAPALLLLALSSCGASDTSNQMSGEAAVENATLTTFALTSEAFADGQPIPTQFTCEGADQPPPLSWSEAPEGTKSFALVVDDPDAPSGTFRHWAAWNLPASARSVSGDFPQAMNDFGKTGYGGPCPPPGHGVHRYRFKLFALDTEKLDLPAGAKVTDVEAAATQRQLGRAELTGTYERK